MHELEGHQVEIQELQNDAAELWLMRAFLVKENHEDQHAYDRRGRKLADEKLNNSEESDGHDCLLNVKIKKKKLSNNEMD